MLDEGIDEAIIFEDDVVILDNFIEVMQNIKNANPKKWHLILFGYIGAVVLAPPRTINRLILYSKNQLQSQPALMLIC